MRIPRSAILRRAIAALAHPAPRAPDDQGDNLQFDKKAPA
jgi:hypothetical protein